MMPQKDIILWSKTSTGGSSFAPKSCLIQRGGGGQLFVIGHPPGPLPDTKV